MSDVKLFTWKSGKLEVELADTVKVEKELQRKIEENLDVMLGVRFLESEYSTGTRHNGRIDTLGVDENGFPVIIEYKRGTDQNVISQGLYYLDWLLDHRSEFEGLVAEKYGAVEAEKVDWSEPRILCVAANFTKFDVHAVQYINRRIELYEYKRFGEEQMMLQKMIQNDPVKRKRKAESKTEPVVQRQPPGGMAGAELFTRLEEFIYSLDSDIEYKQLKHYHAFKRFVNFACVVVREDKLTVTLRLDPAEESIEEGFSRDVSRIGHAGTGDFELTIRSVRDLDKAKPYIEKSFELG